MEEAKKLAKQRNIDLKKVPLKQIKKGLEVEKEHNKLIKNKPNKRMQIVIDHLIEYPDYYKRLDKMEKQADKEWKNKDKEIFKKEGGAITDIITDPVGTIKTAFSDIDDFNNVSRETLEKYGNIPTTIITIARTPLQPLLETAINVMSLGRFKQLKEKYGYDKLYHLSLIIGTRGNQKIVVEKNETVTIEPLNFSKSIKNITEFQKIPIVKPLTTNIMMERTKQKMGSYDFFHYDAFKNNCQDFIKNILEANGLLTPAARKFLYQEKVKNIEKDLNKSVFSYVPKVMKKITDMGSIVSRLAGKGKDEREEIKKAFLSYLKKKNIEPKELNLINEEFIDFINSEGLKFL